MDLGEQAAAANFIGMVEVGRGRVRVFRGPVADDKQGAVRFWRDGHAVKLASLPENARNEEEMP